MDLLLRLLFCLYGTGFVALVWALLRSPEGFEDMSGFHLGRERES